MNTAVDYLSVFGTFDKMIVLAYLKSTAAQTQLKCEWYGSCNFLRLYKRFIHNLIIPFAIRKGTLTYSFHESIQLSNKEGMYAEVM